MIIFLCVTRMDVVHCIILNYYHQMKNDFINNDFHKSNSQSVTYNQEHNERMGMQQTGNHLDILLCNILQ